MRKGVKAISVLLLFCVLLGFTGCNDKAKIVGKWKQSTEHVGFSGTAAAESGSFKLDEKAGQIMFYPDDGTYGSTCFTYTYSISDEQLTIRTLNGGDIVYFKRYK